MNPELLEDLIELPEETDPLVRVRKQQEILANIVMLVAESRYPGLDLLISHLINLEKNLMSRRGPSA